jgi:hypothetical protein
MRSVVLTSQGVTVVTDELRVTAGELTSVAQCVLTLDLGMLTTGVQRVARTDAY